MNHPHVIWENESNKPELIRTLRDNGYDIFEINGEIIHDLETFFHQIVNILPQDPPLSGQVNLDAFVDSLWGGIDNLSVEKVAILWTQINNMLYSAPQDLEKLTVCFNDVAESLLTTEFGLDKPIVLTVYLFRNGNDLNLDN
ncbi:barstar family protein [Brevibacillus dissolubilis]|uniref:barstar family protein n=1 Tax=Brevibacillus dissolubilis TaxID=1844116 RepID=UPI00111780FE|nr:barstar family protein [Brevibacillus dissolubilis]